MHRVFRLFFLPLLRVFLRVFAPSRFPNLPLLRSWVGLGMIHRCRSVVVTFLSIGVFLAARGEVIDSRLINVSVRARGFG